MSDLLKQINSLAIFGAMRGREPLQSLSKFLRLSETVGVPQEEVIAAYSDFVRVVYSLRPDADFSGALWDCLKADDNAYLRFVKINIVRRNQGEATFKISRMMEIAVDRELDILTDIGKVSYITLQNLLFYDGYIAQFKSAGIDMKDRYMEMLRSLAGTSEASSAS